MTTHAQNVLSINVTFNDLQVLQRDDEITNFSESFDSEVIIEESALALNLVNSMPVRVPIRKLTMPRERMFVEINPPKTRFVMEHPDSLEKATLLVKLVERAYEIGAKTAPSSFGCNVDWVYNLPSGENARSYLGRCLFSDASALNTQWTHVGGQGKLFAHEGEYKWTIALEPRFQKADAKKMFLAANLHVDEARIPDGAEVKKLLEKIWNDSNTLIERLDRRAMQA